MSPEARALLSRKSIGVRDFKGVSAYRNENGTYNGAAMMADLTGLSREEILWTWKRLKELKEQGLSADDMKATVAEEAKSKPWVVV